MTTCKTLFEAFQQMKMKMFDILIFMTPLVFISSSLWFRQREMWIYLQVRFACEHLQKKHVKVI